MLKIMAIFVSLACALMCLPSQGLAQSSQIEIAKRFLTALESGDLETAEAMMGPEFVFEDPTYGTGVLNREKAVAAYANYTAGIRSISKHLLSAYESAGVVVLNYIYYVEITPPASETAEDVIPVMAENTRVFEFKDGKIVRHIDLADYAAFNAATDPSVGQQ